MDRAASAPYTREDIAPGTRGVLIGNESTLSGVSWAAVFAGAFVAAALSLILLALGAGLGLSSVSPWSSEGLTSAIGAAAIVWIIVMQVLSSAMGGYLAGRLRTKWTGIHSDEVHFRDTAHGFLAWAVALTITAAGLTSAAATMVGNRGANANERTGVAASEPSGPLSYDVDVMFRTDAGKVDAGTAMARNDAARILTKSLVATDMTPADKTYLTRLVASTAGIDQAEADRRVTEAWTDVQQTADASRKAVAHGLLWIFLALLIGAFCASFAATIGGRQRDHVVTI